MKQTKKANILLTIFLPILIAVVLFTGLSLLVPKAPPRLKETATTRDSNLKEKIHYTAVGDSLTQGVGDQTDQGGFIPLVANQITDKYDLTSVETDNFGVSGERSDQIKKRVVSDEKLRKDLKSSDFITVTVGGNDLMKVIQNNIFGLSIKKFNKPLKNYQKNVASLLEEIRELNPDAPIYVLGIYNPFYLNFPEITDMQTIVDNWNDGTKETVKDADNSYFIPINDLLYQGLDQKVGVTEATSDSVDASEKEKTDSSDLNVVKNDALYEEDHFHPNNIGYQLMANAVYDELVKTKNLWLVKGEN
ncbi:MAG: SGNH/GDSL hydrolase family protein [Enterococcus sp.]